MKTPQEIVDSLRRRRKYGCGLYFCFLLLFLHAYPPATFAADGISCNQQNKQKATYHYPVFTPTLASLNALDLTWDVIWHDLDDLRLYGRGGLFVAQTIKFSSDGFAGGYTGPQVKGSTSSGTDQILFSLWDKNPGDEEEDAWKAAIPWPASYGNRTAGGCYRNCQDCAVHSGDTAPDGSTGTQCKVLYPSAYSGQIFRFRLRRYLRDQQVEMYNRTWTGDVWEVTYRDLTGDNPGEDILVGRQLLHGVTGNTTGLYSGNFFREFLGCNLCAAYESSASTRGPWIAKPSGIALTTDTSRYSKSNDTFTCTKHNITSPEPGIVRWFAGPDVRVGTTDGTWDKTLFTCSSLGDGKYCQLPEEEEDRTTSSTEVPTTTTDTPISSTTTFENTEETGDDSGEFGSDEGSDNDDESTRFVIIAVATAATLIVGVLVAVALYARLIKTPAPPIAESYEHGRFESMLGVSTGILTQQAP